MKNCVAVLLLVFAGLCTNLLNCRTIEATGSKVIYVFPLFQPEIKLAGQYDEAGSDDNDLRNFQSFIFALSPRNQVESVLGFADITLHDPSPEVNEFTDTQKTTDTPKDTTEGEVAVSEQTIARRKRRVPRQDQIPNKSIQTMGATEVLTDVTREGVVVGTGGSTPKKRSLGLDGCLHCGGVGGGYIPGGVSPVVISEGNHGSSSSWSKSSASSSSGSYVGGSDGVGLYPGK